MLLLCIIGVVALFYSPGGNQGLDIFKCALQIDEPDISMDFD